MSEQTPALLGASQPPADQAINDEAPSGAGNGTASRAGNRLQRKRAQDQTEVRASSSLVPRSNKHQRKGPDSNAQFQSGAERGHHVPGPRPRQNYSGDNKISNARGHDNARQHHASIRGDMRQDKTPGLGLLRPQLADDGGERKGRTLSGEVQHDEQETVDTLGEVGNWLESDKKDARSCVRAGERLSLPGPKEPNGPRGTNDSSMPENSTEKFPRDKRRRGQRPSSPSPVANTNDPGLAEAAGKRGKVGGTKISWGAPPRNIVQQTAARPKSGVTTDDAGPSIKGHRPGRGNTDSNAENEQPADDGHSTVSAPKKNYDCFARENPGDRYYLPPPQRSFRPGTSPHGSGSNNSSTPRHNDKRRKDLQQWPSELGERERQHGQHGQQGQQSKASRDLLWRSGGDGNADSSSSLQSRSREARTSTSSDRLYRQQPADHRPMLGASEASRASNMPDWRYGWRGSLTTTSSMHSQDEESVPYYVDRKQVCVFGLTNWLKPASAMQQRGDHARGVIFDEARWRSVSPRKGMKQD